MPDERRYGVSPKSGRTRHYHVKEPAYEEPKETAAERIKRQFEGISAEKRKQMYHDAMGKKKVGSQYRAEEDERQRKQDAYDNSFAGKAHKFGSRIKDFGSKVIGGISNAFRKGKDIATSVGKGAYRVGQGVYHVGRDIAHFGRDVGKGVAKTYRGARSVYRGTKKAAHMAGDAIDYLSSTPASQMAEDTYNGIRKYGGKAASYAGEQGSKLAKAAARKLYENSDSVRGAYDTGENIARAAKKGYKYMKDTSYGQMGKDAYSGAKKGASSLASAAYNLFRGGR